MKIRAVTCFCQPGWPVNRLLLEQLGIFGRHAQAEFQKAGYEVQGLRLATTPLGDWLPAEALPDAATQVSIEAHSQGFEFTSFGPIQPNQAEYYAAVPAILAQNSGSFITASITGSGSQLSLAAARAASELIVTLSRLEANGFANLRFAALANLGPLAPFFPAAYAAEPRPAFGLALQSADLALKAFQEASSLQTAKQNLVAAIHEEAGKLQAIAQKLSKIYRYPFTGLDFTLAPHPQPGYSIAKALEALGLPVFGLHGSTFASAFLTSCLDAASFQRCGFNGLMLPVLEDAGLAAASSKGSLSTYNFLLNSAVCGTGLDVVPLPGDTSPQAIYALLLDLAALALRLNKPLTARLMPIPGKAAGDLTDFDFDYFANSTIMPLDAKPLTNLLNTNETVSIHSRPSFSDDRNQE